MRLRRHSAKLGSTNSLLWYLLSPHPSTQGPKRLLALPLVPPATSFSVFPQALTDFSTVTAVIIVILAVSPWGTLEIQAVDAPCPAGTALGTAFGDQGLAFLQKAWKETGSEEGETG